MYDIPRVGSAQFIWLAVGLVIWFAVPVAVAVVWLVRKKERVTTVLVGAAAFMLFAIALEKPIQNLLAFPTALGLPDHALSSFLNARPVLLALVAGLFPGVFEETGRFVAFKTVLRKRRNRETSISYGIGHGGFEVMFILGITYFQYIVYGVMMNTGAFGAVIDQVAALAPDQVGTLTAVMDAIAGFSAADLGLAVIERVFAVLFHVGASILVFYAARDGKRFWLYPLAVVLHTGMDFFAALSLFGVISLPAWGLELIFAAFGCLTFLGAYLLLYRKDGAAPRFTA
ncbi:MAG: YhfC family intramembrane metalloprotease [Clostridia bacterium]|nr:YhfC family intramembrane metalloprotease [Clostridia bacterium]